MSIEENKALIQRAFAASNAGDIDGSVAATAPDARLNGEPFGREGDRQRTQRLLAAFPDVQYELHDLIAEGDKVAVRYTMRGTQHGELLGIAPTGKAVSMSVTTIYRISDAQVVDLWENYDALGLLRQLGAVPAPGHSAP
jgi:predicted ester cyclase